VDASWISIIVSITEIVAIPIISNVARDPKIDYIRPVRSLSVPHELP
jgi:hypothetical protein